MPNLQQRQIREWLSAHDPLIVSSHRTSVPDHLTHEPESRYVEEFWLPLVGPTPLWAYRRLSLWLAADPRVEISLGQFGASLGTNRSGAVKALERLCRFRFGRIDHDELWMFSQVFPVPPSKMARLVALGLRPSPSVSAVA